MKIFSSILGVVIAALALAFAIANRQGVTLNLWPFGVVVEAPLCVLTLGALFFGVLLGAFLAWLIMLPHRFRAHRLGKDIAALHTKLQEMQQTVLPPGSPRLFGSSKSKWTFWKR